MDKIIYFLISVIFIVILGHLMMKDKEKFSFGFSPNDRYYQHNLNIKQRRAYDLFVEDENLLLKEPRLNNSLRDVEELMNYNSNAEDTNIYEMTRVKKRVFPNNMYFW